MQNLIIFLKEKKHCFAWDVFDMPGIDSKVITHKLNVDPIFKPVKQKIRKFAPKKNQIVNEEMDRIESNGLIREVKHPKWLVNVVEINKNNGKPKHASTLHISTKLG